MNTRFLAHDKPLQKRFETGCVFPSAPARRKRSTRQSLGDKGGRVFFYARLRLSKGLYFGKLGTVFRVVEWTYRLTISREVWPRIC